MRVDREFADTVATSAADRILDSMESRYLVDGWFSEAQYERLSEQLVNDIAPAIEALDFDPDERG